MFDQVWTQVQADRVPDGLGETFTGDDPRHTVIVGVDDPSEAIHGEPAVVDRQHRA
jgi:hypothetical protein